MNCAVNKVMDDKSRCSSGTHPEGAAAQRADRLRQEGARLRAIAVGCDADIALQFNALADEMAALAEALDALRKELGS